jgi:hypothetical protein
MSKDERIDLTQFEGINKWVVEKRPDGGYAIKTGRDNFSLEEAETTAKLPNLIAELKKMYGKEDEIIEYVGYLLATPDVLEQLMGSPSQIHTINNLTASLEKLLDILKNNAP